MKLYNLPYTMQEKNNNVFYILKAIRNEFQKELQLVICF